MNKPAKISRPTASADYASDGYGWAQAQAQLLRSRHFDLVDWLNIIEEIESVGKSQRSALKSHFIQLLVHLIKWERQPERRRRSWYLSIYNHRDEIENVISENPSLKTQLDTIFEEAIPIAQRKAAREMGLNETMLADHEISLNDAFEKHFDPPKGAD